MVGETITLDVHAISELESKSVAKTDDSHKYQYSSNLEGIYGTSILFLEQTSSHRFTSMFYRAE